MVIPYDLLANQKSRKIILFCHHDSNRSNLQESDWPPGPTLMLERAVPAGAQFEALGIGAGFARLNRRNAMAALVGERLSLSKRQAPGLVR
jgi:hypothetical protein